MVSRNELFAILAMVIVQLGYAGMNLTSKVAMDSGMPPLVLVAYRQLFATLAIAPFAYFLERITRPMITKKVLFQIFLCSFFGASINHILYFIGLKKTTAIISSALSNMLPAFTFILAIVFRLEGVGMRTRGGQAKIVGTLVCVGGAMLLSFYHGGIIDISPPKLPWKFAGHTVENHLGPGHSPMNSIFGPLLIIVANIAMAIWFILQAKLSKSFEAPYTSTALTCFMGSIQCTAIAACTNHNISDWPLTSQIRLVSSIYAGVVCSALAFCLMSWTIQRKGPLYVSVFSPLTLVIVALLSWTLRMEKIYIGTAIGSVLIVTGLYAVLWGKGKEVIIPTHKSDLNGNLNQEGEIEDLEKQQKLVELKDVPGDCRRQING